MKVMKSTLSGSLDEKERRMDGSSRTWGQRNIAFRMGLRGSIDRGKRARREGEIGNTKERKDG